MYDWALLFQQVTFPPFYSVLFYLDITERMQVKNYYRKIDLKTDKEKEDLRKKMKDKYETKYDIPERILFMALESVLFDEDQANNLM